MSDSFNSNGLSGTNDDFCENNLGAVAVDTGGKWKWKGGKSGQYDDFGRLYGSPVNAPPPVPTAPPAAPPPAAAPMPPPPPTGYYPPPAYPPASGYYPPPAPAGPPIPPPPTGFFLDPMTGQYVNSQTGQTIPTSVPPASTPAPAPAPAAPADAAPASSSMFSSIPAWGYVAGAAVLALAFYLGGAKRK